MSSPAELLRFDDKVALARQCLAFCGRLVGSRHADTGASS